LHRMPDTMENREARLREICRHHQQDHVFKFWPQLDELKRSALLSDLERVRFAELPAMRQVVQSEAAGLPCKTIAPAPFVCRPPDAAEHTLGRRGEVLLRKSAVAAFTVAGGQGTRLGLDGPKGALPISPVRRKPLFQLFAEQIIATDRRWGGR